MNTKTDCGLISCGAKRISLNGYSINVEYAEKIWTAAASYWQEGKEKEEEFYYSKITPNSTYSNRRIVLTKDKLTFGCQTFYRSNVEAVAKHYNWPTPIREV